MSNIITASFHYSKIKNNRKGNQLIFHIEQLKKNRSGNFLQLLYDTLSVTRDREVHCAWQSIFTFY